MSMSIGIRELMAKEITLIEEEATMTVDMRMTIMMIGGKAKLMTGDQR